MECPHCEAETDSVTRTGENRYSCGECNMVISYDDLEPNLDDLEVVDKRDQVGPNSNVNDEDPGGGDMSADSVPSMKEDIPFLSGDESSSSPTITQQTNTTSNNMEQEKSNLSEREIIYTRGVEGLKQIKKQRLENWLAQTEGAGAQTQNRILMVFDRNKSITNNPHVLYNLLDDELSASPSYINTMVEDVFEPEREHADILEQNGYTPWYERNMESTQAMSGQMQGMREGQSSSRSFNPGQRGSNEQSSGDEQLTKEEAKVMFSQALQQANEQDQRGALMEGLSDATDDAVREMASNVGGLAGTLQRVVDEALVQYARENPEWVIENMGMLQKILGAAEGVDENNAESRQGAEEDTRIDKALSNLGNGGASQDNTAQQEQKITKQKQPVQEQKETQTDEKNPDLDESMLDGSGFTPTRGSENPMKSRPQQGKTEQSSQTQGKQAKDTPINRDNSVEENGTEENTENTPEVDNDNSTEQNKDGDSFDEIFGDVTVDQ